MKINAALKLVTFNDLELGEMHTEDTIPSTENQKQHTDVTEKGVANLKQLKEGRNL